MLAIDHLTPIRAKACALFLALAAISLPGLAQAHFSYSDPRIVHVAADGHGGAVLYVRMPAPLALLPDDWKGAEDSRVPPYAALVEGETFLDVASLEKEGASLRKRLAESVTLWAGGQRAVARIERYVFRTDNGRPSFGTLISARAAFETPFDGVEVGRASYFNLTLDLEIVAPEADLSKDLRLESRVGERFPVISKLGTVVKLHRNDATETSAAMGVLDASFPKIVARWETWMHAALTGAAHIYGGLDHLAIIILIVIAAPKWREALVCASSFTVGHMITLAAGLYGFAPAAAWFAPAVEVSIALTIATAGALVLVQSHHALGWVGMLIVGLVHGYGFASSASEALFAGNIDPIDLAAFAVGLEACQFALYALALPLIWVLDRAFLSSPVNWRRALALVIVLTACSSVIWRFSEASDAFGIV